MTAKLRFGASRAAAEIVMALVIVIVIVPIAWMAYLSLLKPLDIISPGLSSHVSLNNYRAVLTGGSAFGAELRNSALIVVGTVAISLVVASMAGYSLSKLSWPRWFTWTLFGLLGLVQLVPPITLVPGLYVTLQNTGLLGGVLGLVMLNVLFNLPFATLMMKIYFDSVPSEIRQAALIDGASETRTFGTVMLPLVKPGMAALTVFVAIMAWNEFLFGLVFTSGGSTSPITVGIASLVQPYEIKFGEIAAVGAITAVPIIILTAIANRYIVAGLTGSAVKG